MEAVEPPTISYPTPLYIEEVKEVWQQFLQTHSWQKLIVGVEPRRSNCGRIYELPNFLHRPSEGFAIADMRHIQFIEPHYHPAPVVEIYYILQGNALVVVGTEEIKAKPGLIVVIIYGLAHFVIPDKDCVMAIVNVPPFENDHYRVVTETDLTVQFDRQRFLQLTRQFV